MADQAPRRLPTGTYPVRVLGLEVTGDGMWLRFRVTGAIPSGCSEYFAIQVPEFAEDAPVREQAITYLALILHDEDSPGLTAFSESVDDWSKFWLEGAEDINRGALLDAYDDWRQRQGGQR